MEENVDVKKSMLIQLYDAGYSLRDMQEKKFGWWSNKAFEANNHGCIYKGPNGYIAITMVCSGLYETGWDDIKLVGEVEEFVCSIKGPKYRELLSFRDYGMWNNYPITFGYTS